jgi:D-arabinose 1-dehydrogenase-like Zn-dependent alcohol dehydrogenase
MSNKIQPLIDSQCELEEVPDALRKLAAGQARGKIVIILK